MEGVPADPDPDVAALLELWRGTLERIAERRSYEWKIAFGVWAAQLLAMGELITHSSSIRRAWLLFGFYLAAGTVIVVLHWVYLRRFMKVRTNEEGTRARLYEEEAAKRVLGAPLTIAVADGPGTAAHYFELGVTLALAVIGPVAILAVAPSSAFH
jgi:hypothetical protein